MEEVSCQHMLCFLTHLFPMNPFSTSLKHQKTHQGVEKGCIGNKWVKETSQEVVNGKKLLTFFTARLKQGTARLIVESAVQFTRQ